MSTETTERYDPAYPVKLLKESPDNPRKTFTPAKMEELTASVRVKGVVTPLLVRANPNGNGNIAAGHRRYRAAKAAGVETVPALIRPMTDEEFLDLLVFENDEREDPHPLEEAAGYKTMMTKLGWDVGRLAQRKGCSDKYIYDRVKLLQLIPEAAKLFLDNLITPGHAILIARLKPEDQKRAIDVRTGGLFESEDMLWGPDDTMKPTHKARSVRELELWIAEHVRFKAIDADPVLFPAAAAAAAAVAAPGVPKQLRAKIVEITHESYIQQEARAGGERTIRSGFWKYASVPKGKPCDYAVTGVIVVGPEQGQAFPVCVNRDKCRLHWGKEIAAREKKATSPTKRNETPRVDASENRWKREQEKREAERARWETAQPAILKAVAEKVKKAATSTRGPLAALLLGGIDEPPAGYVPLGTSAEDLVRHLAFAQLAEACEQHYNLATFQKHAKALGVDVKKILDAAAPVEKPAAKKKASGKAKK